MKAERTCESDDPWKKWQERQGRGSEKGGMQGGTPSQARARGTLAADAECGSDVNMGMLTSTPASCFQSQWFAQRKERERERKTGNNPVGEK